MERGSSARRPRGVADAQPSVEAEALTEPGGLGGFQVLEWRVGLTAGVQVPITASSARAVASR